MAGSSAVAPLDYVAMGDSYSSGEGNPPFDLGTANSATGDTCHRSKDAWPRLLAGASSRLHLLGLIACSGAKTPAIYQSRFKTEPVQIDQLKRLHPAAGALVTITIGGNDIGFAPAFTDCYEHDCYTDGTIKRVVTNIIYKLPALLAKTFRALSSAVPAKTRVVVVGYPNLITTSRRNRILHCEAWLKAGEQAGLITAADDLDKVERAGARAAGFAYVSTLNAMAGHELCTGKSWLKSVNVLKAHNPQTRQQFAHPLLTGQHAIADAVETYLQENVFPGSAVEVPGLAALNGDGYAQVTALSCPSAGNCAAGGYYTDASNGQQAFVASEVNGTWHDAIEVPGLAALNQPGPGAEVNSMSCASAGNCVAGGHYYGSGTGAFVASEVSGVWQEAVQIPGLGAFSLKYSAGVSSVSCPSAGNCSVAGYYTDAGYHDQAFVASEVNGTWRKAVEVPGLGGLEGSAQPAQASSLSCASAGNCVVTGSYQTELLSDGFGFDQGFVADEVHGTWQSAIQIPGLSTLDAAGAESGGGGDPVSVSCPSAGNCVIGGGYGVVNEWELGFTATEVGGTWHDAAEMPGQSKLGLGGDVSAVRCSSAGNCTITGGNFITSEVSGVWHKAEAPPGASKLGGGSGYQMNSLSCGSAGNCMVGGDYVTQQSGQSVTAGFTLSQVSGAWLSATPVPNLSALANSGRGPSSVIAVSCPPAGSCTEAGYYDTFNGHFWQQNGYVTH